LENGGNRQLPAPHSLEYSDGVLTGIASLASGGFVQVFRDADDEGVTLIAQGAIVGSAFSVPVALNPAHIGVLYQIRATATDTAGNTSEFSVSTVLGPPASRFLFTSTRDGNQEVYLLDGPPPAKRITSHNAADHSAALGGTTIALVSDRTGNQEIFAASTSGVIFRQLTTNSVPDYDPVWTPDWSVVIFASERDGNAEIYSMRFNGAQPTRITTDAASDRWPSVSPDGTKIAFASNRGGKYGLYIMKRDGTGVEAVPQTGLGDTQPVWSNGGTQLAFVSERDGNPEIYVIQADGTNLRRVTTSAARDLHPSWLPGDQKLVFSSDRWGAFALTLTALTGGEPTRLMLNLGDDTEPTAVR
jgi:Tol biopolymer transport system component